MLFTISYALEIAALLGATWPLSNFVDTNSQSEEEIPIRYPTSPFIHIKGLLLPRGSKSICQIFNFYSNNRPQNVGKHIKVRNLSHLIEFCVISLQYNSFRDAFLNVCLWINRIFLLFLLRFPSKYKPQKPAKSNRVHNPLLTLKDSNCWIVYT